MASVSASPSERRAASSLAAFLRTHREAILVAWMAAVRERLADKAGALPEPALRDRTPMLLDEIAALAERDADADAGGANASAGAARTHAFDRLLQGFDVDEVVLEISLLRECIGRHWQAPDVKGNAVLHRALDAALRAAVAQYTAAHDEELRAMTRIAEDRAAELAAVVDCIPAAVLISEAGMVTLANLPALAHIGLPSMNEAHLPIPVVKARIHPRDPETGADIDPAEMPHAVAYREDRPVQRDMLVRDASTGEDRVVTIAAAPFHLGGERRGAVSVQLDITGRLRAEREAAEAAELRERILAVVSHDLRSPLSSITLAAGLLAKRARSTAEEAMAHQVAIVQRAANRMERIISDLLDTAAIREGRLQIVLGEYPVASLLSEAIEAHAGLGLERGVELVAEAAPAARVRCDHERVAQVLANLIGNALKFSEPHTRIALRARVDGDTVRFEVEDHGPGIPADVVARIFEPYFSAPAPDAQRAGTGLGLTISRGIVEAHGGRIWVTSTPGEGSTFAFTLPRVG